MSENSRSYSASFQGMFDRMKSVNVNKVPALKMEEPRVTTEYSRGVRQLSKYGYETYNIDDGPEIYIMKVGERTTFNNGEAVAVKAGSANRVGVCRPRPSMEIESVETYKPVDVKALFGNVQRGTDSNVNAFTGTCVNGMVKKSITLE